MTTCHDFRCRLDRALSPDVPDCWVLPALVRLEAAADRRLIGPLSVAEDDRRSAVFAVLAALGSDGGISAHLAELAPDEFVDWLLSTPPERILTALHGEVPGLAAVIARTGGDPLEDPEDYLRLAALLCGEDPRARLQAECLGQADHVSSRLLRILARLRDPYLRPDVVSAIRSPEVADRIERITEFLLQSCSGLAEDEIARSLASGALFNLHDWTNRMLLWWGDDLCDLADDEDFRFFRTSDDFGACADRDGTDLATPSSGKILNAALGVAAYAEWRHAPVLVELVRMNDGAETFWVCQDLQGPDGAGLSDRLEQEIRRRLRRRGILSLAFTHRPGIAFDVVERLAHVEPVHVLRVHEAG